MNWRALWCMVLGFALNAVVWTLVILKSFER